MNSGSKPRTFQLHLSTAVILMFVTGGLIWANLHAIKSPGTFFEHGSRVDIFGSIAIQKFGWPFPAVSMETWRWDNLVVWKNNSDAHTEKSYLFVALDAAVGLFLLACVWFICERLIRSAKKIP